MSDYISRQAAIEALAGWKISPKANQGRQTEKSGDRRSDISREGRSMSRYIDADKFMKVLEEDIPITDNPIEVMTSAIAALEEQPTADVLENVKGMWIEDNSRERSMMWRCSVCGRIAYYPTIGKRKGFKKHCGYNYCPNCGADMRGEA